MTTNTKNLGVAILAGAASAIGGYAIGNTIAAKATTPATTALASPCVYVPALIGGLGMLLLRKKNRSAANGLLAGGIVGSLYGYHKFSQTAAAGAAAGTGTGTGAGAGTGTGAGAGTGGAGTGATSTAAYLGANPRGRRRRRMAAYLGAPMPRNVRKILNSPTGSGLGNILPRRFQTGSPAFPNSAWSR
jgi:hypothetical protein